MQLAGRVALVTGGGGGIGAAIAERLAREGAVVGVVDIDRDAAQARADRIRQAGGAGLAFQADVSDAAAIRGVMDSVFQAHGRIDILVNNAAVRHLNAVLEQTEEEWARTLKVNLTGPFICTKTVLPFMLKKGKGKIVNVASVAGLFGRPNRPAYCASKGGLIAFTKAAAVDMKGRNININALAPALIETPMNAGFTQDASLAQTWGSEVPMGRWGKPSEVADAALFLASDASDFITGTVITIDGGWTSAVVRATES